MTEKKKSSAKKSGAKKSSAKKPSAKKSSAKTRRAVADQPGPSLDSADPKERAEARRLAGERAAKDAKNPSAARERAVDPNSIGATTTEQADVIAGKAKPENTRPIAVPAAGPVSAVPGIGAVPAGDDRRPASNAALAKVVDRTAANQKLKGYREEEVVATRIGHYELKRRRPGEVFTIGLVGNGYLPSWVRLANEKDKEPGVAQSRQVGRTSTSQEIMDDVREDSGTEAPLYLGGNQRRPFSGSNPRTVV